MRSLAFPLLFVGRPVWQCGLTLWVQGLFFTGKDEMIRPMPCLLLRLLCVGGSKLSARRPAPATAKQWCGAVE